VLAWPASWPWYLPPEAGSTRCRSGRRRSAVEFGADEIDMVIDRGAMLSGEYARVYDEIAQIKEACGAAHLKVILETGELGTYDNVRRASDLAMLAGGDFIKTSTGKITPAATPPVTLVMLEAIRDFYHATGRRSA
jgi:deoxyribose-phosphate aldolase